MKKAATLCTCYFFLLTACHQPFNAAAEYTRQSTMFIQAITRPAGDNRILVDKPFDLSYFVCLSDLLKDTANFTKEELVLIEKQAKHPPVARWTNALVPGTRIISSDTVTAAFNNLSNGWPYVYKHIGHVLYAYSAPVFIRNYTYCLFYAHFTCGGLCGEGHLALYKKEGNTWKEVKTYCDWIS